MLPLHVRALGGHSWLPSRPVRIAGPDGELSADMLIDSGADISVVSYEVGRQLGWEVAPAEVALEVARLLVLFLKRPGGQAQFSAGLAAQAAEREPLRELQRHFGFACRRRACDEQFTPVHGWACRAGPFPAARRTGPRLRRKLRR